MDATGDFIGDLQLSGLHFSGPLVVAPIGTLEGVIGLDLLEKLNIDISLSRGELVIGDHTIIMFKKHKPEPKCCRIMLQESVIIPPCSEIIVEGKVSNRRSQKFPVVMPLTGVVESLKTLQTHHGVLLARSVVRPKDGKIPLKFCNLNDESVSIDKGATVALLLPAAGVTMVNRVELAESGSSEVSLPEHIQPLLDGCKEEISHFGGS